MVAKITMRMTLKLIKLLLEYNCLIYDLKSYLSVVTLLTNWDIPILSIILEIIFGKYNYLEIQSIYIATHGYLFFVCIFLCYVLSIVVFYIKVRTPAPSIVKGLAEQRQQFRV